MSKQCCKRDHDHDGNCDIHPELPLLTHSQCCKVLKDLKEFGYPQLTLEEVKKFAKQIHENKDSKTNVIAVIMRKEIVEAVKDAKKR